MIENIIKGKCTSFNVGIINTENNHSMVFQYLALLTRCLMSTRFLFHGRWSVVFVFLFLQEAFSLMGSYNLPWVTTERKYPKENSLPRPSPIHTPGSLRFWATIFPHTSKNNHLLSSQGCQMLLMSVSQIHQLILTSVDLQSWILGRELAAPINLSF